MCPCLVHFPLYDISKYTPKHIIPSQLRNRNRGPFCCFYQYIQFYRMQTRGKWQPIHKHHAIHDVRPFLTRSLYSASGALLYN